MFRSFVKSRRIPFNIRDIGYARTIVIHQLNAKEMRKEQLYGIPEVMRNSHPPQIIRIGTWIRNTPKTFLPVDAKCRTPKPFCSRELSSSARTIIIARIPFHKFGILPPSSNAQTIGIRSRAILIGLIARSFMHVLFFRNRLQRHPIRHIVTQIWPESQNNSI